MRTITRRMILEVAALSVVSVAGIGAAQDDGEPDIKLGGRTTGWQGVAPKDIEGKTNPTLELVAGEEYVLEWENLDGQGHNFVIEDEDGENVVRTNISTRGSQTVEFTASEEMTEYYCEPHPSQMRGELELSEAALNDEEDERGAEVEEFAAAVDELFDLRVDEDGWHGEHPGEIEDEDDPTLSVLPGETYVISITNDVGSVTEDDDGDDEGDGVDEGDSDMGEEITHEEGTTLELFDQDNEEIVTTEAIEPGQRGAIAFVATEELAGYRDNTLDAEGEIKIGEESADKNGETEDE